MKIRFLLLTSLLFASCTLNVKAERHPEISVSISPLVKISKTNYESSKEYTRDQKTIIFAVAPISEAKDSKENSNND